MPKFTRERAARIAQLMEQQRTLAQPQTFGLNQPVPVLPSGTPTEAINLNDPAERGRLYDRLRGAVTDPAFLAGTAMSLAAPQIGVPARLLSASGLLRPLTGAGLMSTVGRVALGGAGGRAFEGLLGDIRSLLSGGTVREPGQVVGELGQAAAVEGTAEFGGRLVVKTAQKVLAPFARAIPEQVQRTLTFLRESPIALRLKLKGATPFTPAEATTTPVTDIMQNVADRFVLSKPIMDGFRTQRRDQLIGGLAREMTAEVGQALPPKELGRAIVDAASNKFNLAEAPARTIYNAIDETLADRITKVPASDILTAGGRPIDGPRTIVEPALRIDFRAIRQKPEMADLFKKLESAGASPQTGSTTFGQFRMLGNNPTYLEAQEFATTLKAAARELSATAGGGTGARRTRLLLREVTGAIDDSLRGFDGTHGTNLLDMKKSADLLIKQANEEFNPRVVKELINIVNPNRAGDVESVASAILKQPSRIKDIKRAVGGAQAPEMRKIQAFVVQDLLHNKSVNAQGEFTADAFRRALEGVGKTPTESRRILAEVFDGNAEVLRGLERFADVLEISEGKFVGKAGSLAVAFQTTGAFTGLLKIGSKAAAGAGGNFLRFTGGSVLAAKLLTNPKTAKWLTEGMRLPANSERGAAAVGRLMAEAVEAGTPLQLETGTVDDGPDAMVRSTRSQPSIRGLLAGGMP